MLERTEIEHMSEPAQREYRRRWERCRASGSETPDLRDLALFYHANGFYGPALRAYATLRQRDPGTAQWAYMMALIHLKRSENAAALASLDACLSLDATNALAHWHRGRLLWIVGEQSGAREAFVSALAINPDLAHAHLGLARVAIDAHEWERASEASRRAIAIDPNLPTGYMLWAQAEAALGSHARAEALRHRQEVQHRYYDPEDACEVLLDEHCFDVDLLRVRADAHFTALQFERAHIVLKRAAALEPENVDVQMALAKLLLADDRVDEGLPLLEKIAVGHPEIASAHRILAFEHRRRGAGAAAFSAADRGCRAHPRDAELVYARGLGRIMLKELSMAECDFRAAITMSPTQGEFMMALATLLRQQGRGSEAVDFLSSLCEAESADTIPRLELARHLVEEHEFSRALTVLDEVDRINPLLPETAALRSRCLIGIGNLAISCGDNAGALAAFERALQLDPTDLAALRSLFREHAQAGRFDRIVAIIRPFIDRNPGMVEPRYLYAIALLKQDDRVSAGLVVHEGRDLARLGGDAKNERRFARLQQEVLESHAN
jgi:tetratricopeptide (TPR) repeat protein